MKSTPPRCLGQIQAVIYEDRFSLSLSLSLSLSCLPLSLSLRVVRSSNKGARKVFILVPQTVDPLFAPKLKSVTAVS